MTGNVDTPPLPLTSFPALRLSHAAANKIIEGIMRQAAEG